MNRKNLYGGGLLELQILSYTLRMFLAIKGKVFPLRDSWFGEKYCLELMVVEKWIDWLEFAWLVVAPIYSRIKDGY